MVEADAAAAIVEPVEQLKENLLKGKFNHGNAAGKQFLLEKTKGLPGNQRLTLTGANAQKIVA